MIALLGSGNDNEKRVARALELTYAYRILSGTEDEPLDTVIADVLTDLMHLCDNEDLEFDRLLHMATIQHEEET
jgi:hypothetical protein